jgi:hypothetical protein
MFIAVCVLLGWLCWPLIRGIFPKKEGRHPCSSKKRSTFLVSIGLSGLLTLIPTQSYAPPAPTPDDGEPEQISLGVAIIGGIVVVGAAAGAVYVGYKMYKASKKVEEKRKKQLEKEEKEAEQGIRALVYQETRSGSQVARFDGLEDGEWAAWLPFSLAQELTEDGSDCDLQPPFSFTLTAQPTNAYILKVKPYLPAELVSFSGFLTNHALSTNIDQPSYSVDREPANGPSVIRYESGSVVIALPGISDVATVSIDRSLDLVEWEKLPPLIAPRGAIVGFGDSSISRCKPHVYYRVSVN